MWFTTLGGKYLWSDYLRLNYSCRRYASHIGCGIFCRKGRFSGAVSLVEVQKSDRVERLSDAEVRQLVGAGYCPHLYYGKFRPDGRLAHIGHSGLKSEISSMPNSRGISSPLLFSFCTLSRYLYHSFQHCQLVFTPFFTVFSHRQLIFLHFSQTLRFCAYFVVSCP